MRLPLRRLRRRPISALPMRWPTGRCRPRSWQRGQADADAAQSTDEGLDRPRGSSASAATAVTTSPRWRSTLRSDGDGFLGRVGHGVRVRPSMREHWSHLTEAIRTGRCSRRRNARPNRCSSIWPMSRNFSDIFNHAMTDVSELSIAPVIAAYDFGRYRPHDRRRRRWARSTAVRHPRCHTASPRRAVRSAQSRGRSLGGASQNITSTTALRLPTVVLRRRRPSGGDVYLLKNVIHDWLDEDAERIPCAICARRPATGKHVLLVEFVIPAHDRGVRGQMVGSGNARQRRRP